MADKRPDDIRSLWQEQHVEPVALSTEDIARKADGFRSRIRRRNLLEYAAALVVVAAFAVYIWYFPGFLTRVGAALVIVGTLYVVRQLHQRGGVRAMPPDPAVTCLDFHRQELARQRDLLRDIWRWYLGPFVPGLAVFLVGRALEGAQGGWLGAAVAAAICAGVLVAIWRLNENAARGLQREIDALDGLKKDG